MFSSEPTGLYDVLIKSRSHTAMLAESTPFFQKQSAYGVKNGIISAVNRERKRFRSKVSVGGFRLSTALSHQ
jgi:hypothetical protein